MTVDVEGSGTREDPWVLTTPPGTSEFEAYRDPEPDPPALVVQVGATQLRYHLRCIDDLHAMLVERGDWVLLGNADEQKDGQARHRRGVGPRGRTTRSAAGTASRRACAAGSATTCRRCSRRSGWPRSSTRPATTGCGRI